jgi:predicted transcriptional regulator
MVAYYVLKKMNIQPDMFAGLFAAVSAAFTGILTLAFSAFARSKS